MSNTKNLRYMEVKRDLLEIISRLQANERIPVRNELMKRYGVTRTTVDRAISELIGEGYLYSRDGSGTYKAGPELGNERNKTVNSGNWGVILPNIMNDTYPGILRGIEDVAGENGFNVVICNSDNSIEKQGNYIFKLVKSGIKGLIIVPAIAAVMDREPFLKLKDLQLPFVFCNRGVEGINAPKVTSNNFYGGYIATKHLLRLGYERIAYLSRPLYSVSSERYQGYLSALGEAQIEPDEQYAVFEDTFDTEEPGYDSAKKLLDSANPPDAIFCFNDAIAQGAYKAIEEKKLRVGQDIALIGYDNTGICHKLPVKLGSIKFKTYEIGSKAAQILNSYIKGENIPENKTAIFLPELVIRESCRNPRRLGQTAGC